MKAWVTLLTQPDYLVGVKALHKSLLRAKTAWPLVVMVTSNIDAAARHLLERAGCLLREVTPLLKDTNKQTRYANERFAEVWSKLAVWQLTEFERVVFLDADMLVTRNMDELFDLQLPNGWIAACHACRCNPGKIASYPKSWRPENCFYSYCKGVEHTVQPDEVEDYLNGGLLVLKPDRQVFDDMVHQLSALDDLSRYLFAEQDFLNDFYHQRWQPLPYIYNALKTLPFQHTNIWDMSQVKNIHYILNKPWEKAPDPNNRSYPLSKLWWEIALG
ncbi:glycosyltransferase family 8 protein [Erwinia psidii]|uniref:Glycosyltransferase family 8 protein n=1 Tax=Erwinia psidii TaxID=69224 RepID=A0A3N6UUQ4_9GAMM|nr:glycosyltransferase family 8 protein [Erwinia psidii]MCX8956366.1 glycosyltransferase family 8 protein [Erwinia psidii]MCX8959876.1 glycosyltransferase family 8 protein [Erwinia psidii]RQM36575.1 glycosyltransferase family 8 protein [Erwinia psidii]